MTEVTPRTVVAFDEVANLAGTDLGATGWMTITQDMVNTFADATSDHQWIHTDVERAKEGPLGAPIGHGFLTLSLLIPFWSGLLDGTGVSTKGIYSLAWVRFINPVRIGSRLGRHAEVGVATAVRGSSLHRGTHATIESEGEGRPAVVATFLSRCYA